MVMADEMSDKTTMAQTYVWHKGRGFFVSTINRPSSSMECYGMLYSETMVWEWDEENRTRGNLIGQDEHAQDSIFAHQRMVQRIFDTGSVYEVMEDE